MASFGLIILFLTPTLTHAFVFESMEHMKNLITMEKSLEESLDNYITASSDTYVRTKEFAQLVHNQTQAAKDQGSRYLDSPINAYAIIKRFTDGWGRLDNLIKIGKQYQDLMDLLNKTNTKIPTKDNVDFFGAIAAIVRLQNTYNLTTRSIVDGHIPGCLATTPMTADDCYEFGSAAYKSHQFMRSREWIEEGIRLVKKPGYDGSTTLASLLEYLAWVEYLTGNNEKALNITRELIRFAPYEVKYQNNEIHYSHIVEHETPFTPAQMVARNESVSTKEFINSTYSRLCQGKPVEVNHSQDTSQLTCWFHGNHDPRLILKPFKIEQISAKPKIYMVREFLRDNEATRIKELATPLLSRATVFNPKTEKLENADYRVAKSAWLDNHMDDVVARVNYRASVMAGLDYHCAEHLQVGNYGMGGQYEQHVDFGDPGTPIERDPVKGNRIATLLIYLNEVPSGGATVFLHAGVQVLPSKNDAVFWFNLKRSGEGDYSTLHAGCPVMCGNKWVANKWFRIKGNIFRRPCALDKNL